jgi:imidazolonepropionase-like amidohydrolase
VLLLAMTVAGGWADDLRGQAGESAGMALRVAKIVAMDDADTVINDAVVLVRDGQIEALGPAGKIEVPESYRVLEFPEHWLVPGIVDAHNHSAAGAWDDLNDMVYQTNPGLDTRSIPQADNDWIRLARMGGVTTVMLLPGSGTNLAGMGTVVNTGGRDPDEIVIRSPGSLKIAQAGNPEWYFGGNGRMFMYWNLRQTLEKAEKYHQSWLDYEEGRTTEPPPFDPTWEIIRDTFRHKNPATMHTQGYQLMMSTLDMITGRFGMWTVLDHCTFNGWKLGPLVCETDAWAINGPRQYEFDRTARRMIGNASGWWKNGVRRLGINTDAPVIPQQELTYQAAMACWYGWLPYPALQAVTRVNAQSIGVYDQVGSVEVGKQADLSIWTGDPLDPRSACLLTILKGRIIYDGTEGLRRF